MTKKLMPIIIMLTFFACDEKLVTIPPELVNNNYPPGHLNDNEMLTPIDYDAPFVHDAWKNWVKSNSHPIRSLTSTNYTDLSFLTEYLTGARIVQMGEIVHGAAKQNAVRVRIIKYLHEEMGFNVVAFES